MRILRNSLIGIGLLSVGLALFAYVRYGGGRLYPDTSGVPLLGPQALETVVQYPEPIGNVAVSNDTTRPTRLFFTVHPESHPEGATLLEWVNRRAVPYPDEASQNTLYTTVLGLYIDQQHRLWAIDHGNNGTEAVRLTAFDLTTNRVVHRYTFPREVAELGSFFNDLSVSPDGRYVVVADVSFWRKQPSLVVYDTRTRRSISRLDGHESVTNQGYVPVNPIKKMRFVAGLVDLMPGIDGIDFSPDGRYVYYAAMAHEGLYRVPTNVLTDFTLPDDAVAKQVERVARKPLSDGIRVDAHGTTYVTDIEHSGVTMVSPTGKVSTLLKDPRIRWADGLSVGGDGYVYLADSAIPEQMLQSKANIAAKKPYFIYRFRPVP